MFLRVLSPFILFFFLKVVSSLAHTIIPLGLKIFGFERKILGIKSLYGEKSVA